MAPHSSDDRTTSHVLRHCQKHHEGTDTLVCHLTRATVNAMRGVCPISSMPCRLTVPSSL